MTATRLFANVSMSWCAGREARLVTASAVNGKRAELDRGDHNGRTSLNSNLPGAPG